MWHIILKISGLSLNPDLFVVGMACIYFTGLILLIAVGIKFWEHAQHPQQLSAEKPHFFATKGMTLFVLFLFPFWINSWCQFKIDSLATQYIFFGVGLSIICLALFWHLWAKLNIGILWSDDIEIKEKHPLITHGAFAWARHPMYASLLMWCWGASLMMFNWGTLLAVTCLFLPLMILRAKEEERALVRKNMDYIFYQRNVRMITLTTSGIYSVFIRLILIGLVAYFLITQSITFPVLCLLVLIHLYLGFSLLPEKAAFSYRSKAGMMLITGLLGLYVWSPFFYLFYLFIAMSLYGLKWNCPCMIVYEKYHGCPCFILIKKYFSNQ